MVIQNNSTMPNAVNGFWIAGKGMIEANGNCDIIVKGRNLAVEIEPGIYDAQKILYVDIRPAKIGSTGDLVPNFIYQGVQYSPLTDRSIISFVWETEPNVPAANGSEFWYCAFITDTVFPEPSVVSSATKNAFNDLTKPGI